GLLLAGGAGEPVKAIGGRKNDTHLVPGVGDRVTGGVYGALGIGAELFVGNEQNTRGPERDKALTRPDRANAAGRSRIVTSATGHDHRPGHTPAGNIFGLELSRNGAALDQRRHVVAREPGDAEQFVRPVTSLDVEPERTGCVGHVLDMLAG